MITIADVERARARIKDAIYVSPCAHSETFSKLTGNKVYFKLENLQMTGSFKERGALNKILSLTDDEKRRGVIAASAGNHAQGVSYHATRQGLRATIVMPTATPLVKVTRTREYGAEVVLHGASYDEAFEEAWRRHQAEGFTFIHAFDDDAIMAGQGTIGLELLEQNPYLEAVVLAVGGGGLAAGVAVAIKETNPRIKVYGVETAALPSMKRALEAGQPVVVPPARTIAEGIAVRRAGDKTLEVVRNYLDDVVLVDEEEIAEAILLLLEKEKTVAEGAGAAPLAALVHRRLPVEGKKVAIVVCGGNIDVNVISRIIERGLVKSGRIIKLAVRLPDVTGALARLAGVVAEANANVLQIHHDRTFAQSDLNEALVELVLETRGFEHATEVRAALTNAGYRIDGRG
jgi:threonine dehydratase